jgi:hypothetical protein
MYGIFTKNTLLSGGRRLGLPALIELCRRVFLAIRQENILHQGTVEENVRLYLDELRTRLQGDGDKGRATRKTRPSEYCDPPRDNKRAQVKPSESLLCNDSELRVGLKGNEEEKLTPGKTPCANPFYTRRNNKGPYTRIEKYALLEFQRLKTDLKGDGGEISAIHETLLS